MTQQRSAGNGFNKKRRKPAGAKNRPAANRKKQSSINVDLLTQKAAPQVAAAPYKASRAFADTKLHPSLKGTIKRKGFQYPTEIQDKSLDILLNKQDILGIAQTGTGKTGAFIIPIINRLLTEGRNFQTLILVPTRELALQVEEEFKSLTGSLGLYCSCFIGGTNINRDMQKLRRSSHVVIGTPGRLLDLYKRRALRFNDFEVLILDEFDRMLDIGFAQSVKQITAAMNSRKHTMLFSATLDKRQQSFINELLHKPAEVKVSSGEATGDHIDQEIIKVAEGENKFQTFLDLINQPGFDKVIVFAETKRWVSRVNKSLVKAGIKTDEIHGNKSQAYRQKALTKFKAGKIKVLVATDVAARGIDVSDVTHVINYQLPGSMDSYIHRIGRTGRAGKTGKAYTFIN